MLVRNIMAEELTQMTAMKRGEVDNIMKQVQYTKLIKFYQVISTLLGKMLLNTSNVFICNIKVYVNQLKCYLNQ